MHITHDDSATAPPHLPAMIAQNKACITTAVARRLAKLIQYLLFYLLTALAVALDRHRCDCLSLLHRQPHLCPPAPVRGRGSVYFSSRFLYEATNTFSSRFSVSQFALPQSEKANRLTPPRGSRNTYRFQPYSTANGFLGTFALRRLEWSGRDEQKELAARVRH